MGALGILTGLLWLVLRIWVFVPIAISLGLVALVFHLAARQVRRGRAHLALTIEAAGNLYFVVLCSLLLGPGVMPVLVLLALWPVMVALPYVKGRELVWRMGASVSVALVASVLALRADPFGAVALLPPWLLPALNLLLVPPYCGFTCWMLWHYSKGLNETVDELHSSNAALQRSERLLERKVEERTRELAQKTEQLLKLDSLKSQFLSNASHELRAPLTSIRAFSEMLVDDPTLNESQQEFVRIINSESERLARLTTNLLDLSRIETGNVVWHPQPVDLEHETRELILSQRPLADEKHLDLLAAIEPALPPVHFDPDGLHQVLANLLTNALKFTERGSITISAHRRGAQVSVAVSDTGSGIGEEDQARVFEPFFQAGNVLTEKPSGAGLGLAICRQILTQQGSEIRLTSRLGEGSRFEFDLPIAS